MTMHDEWQDRLSDYLDDELSEEDRDAVAAHIESCASCAALLRDLATVARVAAGAPVREPAVDLWADIEQRLTPTTGNPVLDLPSRRYSFSVFELVAAGLVLAVASGFAATRLSRPTAPPPTAVASDLPADILPASFEDSAYDAAVADLETALKTGRDRLDPETVRIVEENLQIVNQALDDARHALADDPANEYLSDYVVETRRRKLSLLRHAAALTTDGELDRP
jgi:hypothetical protein